MSYCYVIETPSAFRFGYSADPWRRLSQINAGAIGSAKLLGYVDGSRRQEARLHELLSRYHISGEWFAKTTATRRAADLFPKREKSPRRLRLIVNNKAPGFDSEKDAAHDAVFACLLPGEHVYQSLKRISEETGISYRTVKGFWYREAKNFRKSDHDLLVALAKRVRGSAG